MFDPSPELISFQKSLEGFKAKPYICPGGKPTIGYGTTFYPATKEEVTMDDPSVTELQATEMLVADLRNRISAVIGMISWEPPKHVVEALVSLSRNIGLGPEGLAGSTCLKELNSGKGSIEERIQKAAVALKMWNKAKDPKTGELRVLGGLVSRRADEYDIMLNGWNSESSSHQTAASVVENPPSVLNSGRARWAIGGLLIGAIPILMTELPRILAENSIPADGDATSRLVGYVGMAAALVGVLARSFKEQKAGSFGSQGRATNQ